jgi:hypothetical protein
MPQRRNTRRRDPRKNGRMTKRQVSRKNRGTTKRRVSRKNRRTRRKRRTRRVVSKNQKGGHLSVAQNLVMLAALGLWVSGELDDFLVGPLTDLRSKKVKKVLKKGKRSLKRELNISGKMDKMQDAIDDVFHV